MHTITCENIDLRLRDGWKLVDVREPYEYEQGHIKGAVNKPLSEFRTILKDCCDDPDAKIMVYCRTGARSGMAAQILQMNGFDVENIGGIIHYPKCLI